MSDDREGAHSADDGAAGEDPAAVDAAWEDIIAHYGDRAPVELPDPAAPRQAPEAPFPASPDDGSDEFANAWWAREEHFVPPTPPPAPLPAGPRGVAWLGVLGSPVAMLVLVLLHVAIPSWLGLLLFAGF
ncbi:MAG TPA: hypothetical protein VF426_07425, partial [Marmoricola sp.]